MNLNLYLDTVRKKESKGMPVVCIRLPKELIGKLKDKAAKEDVTLSDYIRAVLICKG